MIDRTDYSSVGDSTAQDEPLLVMVLQKMELFSFIYSLFHQYNTEYQNYNDVSLAS
jgi:hypothetical protein